MMYALNLLAMVVGYACLASLAILVTGFLVVSRPSVVRSPGQGVALSSSRRKGKEPLPTTAGRDDGDETDPLSAPNGEGRVTYLTLDEVTR